MSFNELVEQWQRVRTGIRLTEDALSRAKDALEGGVPDESGYEYCRKQFGRAVEKLDDALELVDSLRLAMLDHWQSLARDRAEDDKTFATLRALSQLEQGDPVQS